MFGCGERMAARDRSPHAKYKMWDSIRKQTGQILAYGVSMEYIDSNPMRKTLKPKRQKNNTNELEKFYNKEELKH